MYCNNTHSCALLQFSWNRRPSNLHLTERVIGQRNGQVAVVTGGASGIGLALAGSFARAQLGIVLADVQADALAAAETRLRDLGVEVLSVQTDVGKEAEVQSLAAATMERFGLVQIVCDKAIVCARGGSKRELPIRFETGRLSLAGPLWSFTSDGAGLHTYYLAAVEAARIWDSGEKRNSVDLWNCVEQNVKPRFESTVNFIDALKTIRND
jgi:NAD(P)-dependent dehydrogenase (short-subunit alcohol dehydrogenase family)